MWGKRAGVAAVAVAIGGCHLVFDVDGNEPGTPCEMGDNATGFELGCEPWGSASTLGDATEAPGDGAMVLTAGSGNTYAGCWSNAVTDITRGTTLRMTNNIDPLEPIYFLFELFEADGGPGLYFSLEAGVLVARAGAETLEEVGRFTLPPGGTWLWRWREAGAGWIAEISDDDGASWLELGGTDHHPTRAYPNIGIGSYGYTAAPNAVAVDAYNLCP